LSSSQVDEKLLTISTAHDSIEVVFREDSTTLLDPIPS